MNILVTPFDCTDCNLIGPPHPPPPPPAPPSPPPPQHHISRFETNLWMRYEPFRCVLDCFVFSFSRELRDESAPRRRQQLPRLDMTFRRTPFRRARVRLSHPQPGSPSGRSVATRRAPERQPPAGSTSPTTSSRGADHTPSRLHRRRVGRQQAHVRTLTASAARSPAPSTRASGTASNLDLRQNRSQRLVWAPVRARPATAIANRRLSPRRITTTATKSPAQHRRT